MGQTIGLAADKVIVGLELGVPIPFVRLAVLMCLLAVVVEQGRFDLGLLKPAFGRWRKGEQALAVLQGRRRTLDSGLVFGGLGRVLEADDISARRDQLNLDRLPVDSDIELSDAVDVGGVLPFCGLGYRGQQQGRSESDDAALQ